MINVYLHTYNRDAVSLDLISTHSAVIFPKRKIVCLGIAEFVYLR